MTKEGLESLTQAIKTPRGWTIFDPFVFGMQKSWDYSQAVDLCVSLLDMVGLHSWDAGSRGYLLSVLESWLKAWPE